VRLTAVEDFVHHLTCAERSPPTIKNYLCDLAAFHLVQGHEWGRADPGTHHPDRSPGLQALPGGPSEAQAQQRESPARHAQKFPHLGGRGRPPASGTPTCPAENRPPGTARAVERGGQIRDIAMVTLLLNTGLRLQELCTLTWHDVQVTARTGLVTVTQGKGAKHRQLPLNAEARRTLVVLGYAVHAGSSAPVFMGQRGRLTPSGVQRLLRKYAHAAHLEVLSPHRLRHTFCKRLIDCKPAAQ
jgi:Phage integrase family